MKDTERDEDDVTRSLDQWLDGGMDSDEERTFAQRRKDDAGLDADADLALAIEDSMRRTFAFPGERTSTGGPPLRAMPPTVAESAGSAGLVGSTGANGMPADLGARGAVETDAPDFTEAAARVTESSRLFSTSFAVAALLGLAASIAMIVLLGGDPAPVLLEELDAVAEAPLRPVPVAARGVADVRVGPLLESVPGEGLGLVSRPDLETLYSEASEWSAGGRESVCGEPGELALALAASYGEEIDVRPGALGRLQGPFASSEWPTGMVLTGQADASPAVLVAERESTYTCCVAAELPADSDLKVFTWRVGGILLTEITPLSEPRLLDYFASAE